VVAEDEDDEDDEDDADDEDIAAAVPGVARASASVWRSAAVRVEKRPMPPKFAVMADLMLAAVAPLLADVASGPWHPAQLVSYNEEVAGVAGVGTGAGGRAFILSDAPFMLFTGALSITALLVMLVITTLPEVRVIRTASNIASSPV
jgi:hypothetical protein